MERISVFRKFINFGVWNVTDENLYSNTLAQLILIWDCVKRQTLLMALLKFEVHCREMIFRDCGILWLQEMMCCLVEWTDEWVHYFGLLKGWDYVFKSSYLICGLFGVAEGMNIYLQVQLLNISNDYTRLPESVFLIQICTPRPWLCLYA